MPGECAFCTEPYRTILLRASPRGLRGSLRRMRIVEVFSRAGTRRSRAADVRVERSACCRRTPRVSCRRSGTRTASVHSPTSIIDGLAEYARQNYAYRSSDVRSATLAASGTLLARRLCRRRSDHEPIRVEFTRLHHPSRWARWSQRWAPRPRPRTIGPSGRAQPACSSGAVPGCTVHSGGSSAPDSPARLASSCVG